MHRLTLVALFMLLLGFINPCSAILQQNLQLSSSKLKNNSSIPKRYSCEGQNISPPVEWSNAPLGTRTFALIVSDPDAPNGTWYHWVVFNIPSDVSYLAENASASASAMRVARNSWGKHQYSGPCPPAGKHRYIITLYALNKQLPEVLGEDTMQIVSAIKHHAIEMAELSGTYSR